MVIYFAKTRLKSYQYNKMWDKMPLVNEKSNIARSASSFVAGASSLVLGLHKPTIMYSSVSQAQGANAVKWYLLEVLRLPRTLVAVIHRTFFSWSPLFSHFSLLFLCLLLTLNFKVKWALFIVVGKKKNKKKPYVVRSARGREKCSLQQVSQCEGSLP